MIIPKQIQFLLSKLKDKRSKSRLLKVYEALVYKSDKKNKNGWFFVPSLYLKKVNSRYSKAIKDLIDYGILEYKKSVDYEYETIFKENKIERKSYNTYTKTCMQYRFLIDIKNGEEKEFDINIENLYKHKRWYNLTKKSLIELGLNPRIKRDNFSRRLHTNVTGSLNNQTNNQFKSYKDYCKGYYTIDSVTSQPRLLYIILKEKELYDKNLFNIFENDMDFYTYLQENIPNLTTREMAKDTFGEWVNGKNYESSVENKLIRRLFPIATMLISNYKSNDYKDLCKLLQYKESKIWVDDLLENCPTDFALTVHDSLIVKEEDKDKVLKYCEEKYPELKFKLEKI